MENVQHTPPPKKKNKLARGCGCLFIIAVVAFIIIALIGVFGGKKDGKAADPRKEMLEQDLEKVTAGPPESDSIATFLKPCVISSIHGIKTGEIKWFTKTNGHKLLVLLKVGDMKGIEKSTRKLLVEGVEECLLEYDPPGITETYIGVDGNWNMLMVKTPHASELGGKFADKNLLLPFYDETSATKPGQ